MKRMKPLLFIGVILIAFAISMYETDLIYTASVNIKCIVAFVIGLIVLAIYFLLRKK